MTSITNPTTVLLIVRHGQTDWNVERRIQGHTDIPLNETGKSEARVLAEKLQNSRFAACYTSDLMRAHETAAILAQPHTLPVQQDARLRERRFGSWEGRLSKDLLDQPHPERSEVESHQDICERSFQCFDELAAQHPNETVLVVTHGGLMSNILIEVGAATCSAQHLKTRNTATIQLERINEKWVVKDIQGITLATGEPLSLGDA